MKPRRVLAGLGALVLLVAPLPAQAISGFAVTIHATMTLEGPVADIIAVLDVTEDVTDESSTTGFPSFTNSSGSVSYDPATHTLTVIARSNGAANFAGGIPQAVASAVSRVRGTLGLINPSQDIGFFLDIRVHATMEYAGSLSHPAEYAETLFDIQFAGNRLDGLPADGVLVPTERTSTLNPGLENGYDLVTTTEILGLEERYTVRIPPGGPGFEILDLGLFLQAGGAAASRVDGSTVLALEFLPEPPTVLSEPEFVDPDGDGVPIGTDLCPNTAIPESVPARELGHNRWALVDGNTTFDTRRGRGSVEERGFTLTDTAGCSCEQIVDALGLGHGHKKFGCSSGVMRQWLHGLRGDGPPNSALAGP